MLTGLPLNIEKVWDAEIFMQARYNVKIIVTEPAQVSYLLYLPYYPYQ